jgi:adenylate cyclase
MDGAHETLLKSSRTSSTLMDKPSVRMISTSGCAPFAADLHSLHVPHPAVGQMSAWAKAIAAVDRPEPGGPVNTAGVGHAVC